MAPTRVVVIGAGWSGLAAAKTYTQLFPDTDVTIIDRDNSVGGVWSKDRLYPNLYAQITYPLFEYPGFPMKAEGLTPEGYISGKTIHSYLHDFAVHFDILKLIRFRTFVKSARRAGNGWILQLQDLDGPEDVIETLECDKMIIANGPTSAPKIPNFPRENFTTHTVHSKDIGMNLDVLGSESVERVTVIGAAKSSFDAVYLAMERGKKVDWIMRENGAGPIVMYPPRYLKVANIMDLASMRLTSKMSPDIMSPDDIWYRIFQRSPLGIPLTRAFWGVLGTLNNWYAGYSRSENANKLRPKPDSAFWCNNGLGCMSVGMEFWEMFHSGLCTVHHGNVANLKDNNVILADGTTMKTDFVIYCTGYDDDVPMFNAETMQELGIPSREHSIPVDQKKVATAMKAVDEKFPILKSGPKYSPKAEDTQRSWLLYRRIVPPKFRDDRSVVFLGQIHCIGTAMLAGVASLWAVSFLEGKVEVPSQDEMEQEAMEWNAWTQKRYLDAGTKFPYAIYDFIPYIDNLMRDMKLPVARKPTVFQEFIEPYGSRDYRGIYSEWHALYGRDSKESIQTTPQAAPPRATWIFKILACGALISLWAIPSYYGMVHNMLSQVFITSKLEDGERLISNYTGLWPIDKVLATLVTFFYPVTYGRNVPIHILMIEAMPNLFFMSLYMTIESYRAGNKKADLMTRKPWLWGICYQCLGGAVIFPLWAIHNLSEKPQATVAHYSIPKGHAQILPISLAFGALLPTYFVLRNLHPENQVSSSAQQWMLAIYQVAPLLVAAFQHILGTLCTPPRSAKGPSSASDKPLDFSYIKRAALFAFTVCTSVHILALYLARNQLRAVFNPFTGLPSDGTMGSLVSYFLRWDHVIMDLTFLAWSYMACFRGFDVVVLLAFVPAYLVCGAGGVMALAFLGREMRARRDKV